GGAVLADDRDLTARDEVHGVLEVADAQLGALQVGDQGERAALLTLNLPDEPRALRVRLVVAVGHVAARGMHPSAPALSDGLHRVDAFPLSAIRYAAAAALLLALLALVEGRRAFRLDGHGLRLFWLGALGFAGFNLLAYTGLAHARPQSASLIVALGPLLTALVLWRRTRVRPSASTLALLGVALTGVALVISGGHPMSIVNGSIGWGDALVLGGVFSFVLYGLGAAEFPELS